ncbi:Conserved_hypothetical protein [Hexamita inflata]|uniref:Uncharacterized protein n=1 Tax=Hexamita inflata TaxID=28002 RepID=A0AA86P099_9EUKA|nr:Conserved hypothetical protein [Hexamita inflata]
MIALSQTNNVLVAFIRYWINSVTEKSEIYDAAQNVYKQLDNTFDEVIIPMLPPSLELLTQKSLFAAMVLSIILKPADISKTVQIYVQMMHQYIGDTFTSVSGKVQPCVKTCSTGIIKYTNYLNNCFSKYAVEDQLS